MKKIRTAKRLISEFVETQAARKALEMKEDALKAEIIALMESDIEMINSTTVRNTLVISKRIDTKKAKKELGEEVYFSLCKDVISHKFTVSI